MKNLMLVLLVLISTQVFSQPSLKGIKLGSVYTGKSVLATSVGGIEGALVINTLNDHRVYGIMFTPALTGVELVRIYNVDVENLIEGISTYYNIRFTKANKDDYSEDYWYRASKGKYKYLISTEHNQFLTPPTEFVFWLTDEELEYIHKKEEQKEINKDF